MPCAPRDSHEVRARPGCHGQIRPAYWRCGPHRADGAWHRHPETHCRYPVHPCQATGPAGASAPPMYSPCECRLPAGLTERDGIGMVDPGSAQRVPHEGLDHWSSNGRAVPTVQDGAVPGRMPPTSGAGCAVFDKTRIAGPCARASTEQPGGQNGHIKGLR